MAEPSLLSNLNQKRISKTLRGQRLLHRGSDDWPVNGGSCLQFRNCSGQRVKTRYDFQYDEKSRSKTGRFHESRESWAGRVELLSRWSGMISTGRALSQATHDPAKDAISDGLRDLRSRARAESIYARRGRTRCRHHAAHPGSKPRTSTYLHKSEYLVFGAEENTTAFFHSKGAAFSL